MGLLLGGGGYNAWTYFNWRGVMKKYLFGLGAMLVGAGLMFVLMHGEVSAENDMTVYDAECYLFKTNFKPIEYCMIKDLTCIISKDTSSCVRGSMFK